MRLITVRMDEDLVRQVEEFSQAKGVTRSAFIKGILEAALERQGVNRVRKALSALRQGSRPAQTIDWARIEEELEKTEPHFPTLEEAALGGR